MLLIRKLKVSSCARDFSPARSHHAHTHINLFSSLRCKFLYTKVHLKARLVPIYLHRFSALCLVHFAHLCRKLHVAFGGRKERKEKNTEQERKKTVSSLFIRRRSVHVSIQNNFGCRYVNISPYNLQHERRRMVREYIYLLFKRNERRGALKNGIAHVCQLVSHANHYDSQRFPCTPCLKYHCRIVNLDNRDFFCYRTKCNCVEMGNNYNTMESGFTK